MKTLGKLFWFFVAFASLTTGILLFFGDANYTTAASLVCLAYCVRILKEEF
jgi:hypothetical protein